MSGTLTRLYALLAAAGVVALLGCSTPGSPVAEAGAGSPVAPVASALPEAAGSSWRFVVFGDTRDATRDTPTGISPMLAPMAEAIAAEKPALVIHLGDLINGYYTTDGSPVHRQYARQFDNWKAAVKPIYDFGSGSGIPLFVVRGNHEDGELISETGLKQAYVQSIGRFMPQNGPANEKGLSYSVPYRQTAFIAVDEYSIKELGLLRGLVDQPWLDGELAQLPRQRFPFVFVFGHQPAYKVSKFTKGPFPDLYEFPAHRDAFWKSLELAGVSAYFCGHVHFYNRVSKGSVQQVLIGNGGANTVDFDPRELDAAVTLRYPPGPVKAADVMPGYLVLTVDEAAQTVVAVQKVWNAKTARWETGDRFDHAAVAARH